MADDVIEYGRENPALGGDGSVLTQGSRFTPRIEFNAPGAGFLERAGASIPTTTEGKAAFLERMLGAGNVRTTSAGEILIQDPDNPGVFAPFDERGFSYKDITADLVGPGIEVAPALAAGTAGGGVASVATAAAGAAGGAAIRTGLSELLTGGNTGQTRTDQAIEIGTAALFGAAGQGVANLGARVFDALKPGNFVARQARKLTKAPFAKKGERLSEKTGIPLTLGETVGKRSANMVEAIARRHPVTADDFYDFHQNQLVSAMASLKRGMDKLAAKPGQPLKVGDDIVRAYDEAVESAVSIRRAQAATDFAEVDLLASGQKIVPPFRLAKALQDIVDELNVPGAGDATQQAVKQAKATLADLIDEDRIRRLTAPQVNRLLGVYSAAQRGTGNLFRDMDKAQSRWIAGRLRDALEGDLDEVARSGMDPVIQALRLARDRYRANSDAIREIGDSTLARLVGNRSASPEAIAEKMATKLRPSEVREAMGIIEKVAPDTARSVRRFFIETAIANARPAVTQQSASGVKFSAAKFVSSLPDIETMKAAGFSRGEIVEIGQVAKVLERVADRAFEGSPTGPILLAWDALKGVWTLNPVAVARSVGAIVTPRKIAAAVLTPEGRKALLEVAETKTRTRTAFAAAMTLSAIIATEPRAENARPLAPLTDETRMTEKEALTDE